MQNSQAAPEVGPTKHQESAEGGHVGKGGSRGDVPIGQGSPCSHGLPPAAGDCHVYSGEHTATRLPTLPLWGLLGKLKTFAFLPLTAQSSPSLVCYWMQVLDAALGVAVVAGP